MDTNDIDAHIWLIVFAIHYSRLLDHVSKGYIYFDAT
jgi:hypothetical protein